MRYPMHQVERVTLNEGTSVALRTIRVADGAALRATIERLSPQSRRQRFMSTKSELTDQDLEGPSRCDGDRNYALVAAVQWGQWGRTTVIK